MRCTPRYQVLCPETVRTIMRSYIMRSYVYLERARTNLWFSYTLHPQLPAPISRRQRRLSPPRVLCCGGKTFRYLPMLFKTCRHVRCHGGGGVSEVYWLKSTRNSPACTSRVARNLPYPYTPPAQKGRWRLSAKTRQKFHHLNDRAPQLWDACHTSCRRACAAVFQENSCQRVWLTTPKIALFRVEFAINLAQLRLQKSPDQIENSAFDKQLSSAHPRCTRKG